MDDINKFLENLVSIAEAERKVKLKPLDLGPLNEHSRSLLHAKLSPQTRALEEARLAKMEQKRRSLRNRKKYSFRKGSKHPNKKKATERRRLAKKWKEEPANCINHNWGCWKIDPTLWAQYVQPFWDMFDSKCLTWKRSKAYGRYGFLGTKLAPYSVWCIQIWHSKHGLLFDGEEAMIWHLSKLEAQRHLGEGPHPFGHSATYEAMTKLIRATEGA